MEIFLKGYILRSWFILYQNFGVGGYFGVVPCPNSNKISPKFKEATSGRLFSDTRL